MAVTQFEATDARRAFPCWDEPAKKATFAVTMVVPDGRQCLSNMPVKEETPADEEGGTRTIKFDTTPVMSTYLLAFVIGEFEAIRQTTKNGVRDAYRHLMQLEDPRMRCATPLAISVTGVRGTHQRPL